LTIANQYAYNGGSVGGPWRTPLSVLTPRFAPFSAQVF
jgi:hypothetical protein